MFRTATLAIALVALLAGLADGQTARENLSIGVTVGAMRPMGGDEDYEDAGLTVGVRASKPLTDRWSLAINYHHGETESGEPPAMVEPGRFYVWGDTDYLKTNWDYIGVSGIYDFACGGVVPYVSLGFGMEIWSVEDWRDGVSPAGSTPDGYDAGGDGAELRGSNFIGTVGAGLEIYIGDRVSVDIGASYGYLLRQDVDNIGFSAVYGPDFVDANNSVVEASVGVMWHFGDNDCDGDGIVGSKDLCRGEREDYDGFEDEDGCPDPDNDADGIADVVDGCPDDAEDMDGDADDDGCPDIDRDADGVADAVDMCPDDREDVDGFEDEDGCPDPDNDGDGVLDADDECPSTPWDAVVDVAGCPASDAGAELQPVTASFDLNQATIGDRDKARLDALARILMDDPTVALEISGHAFAEGADEQSQELSERRAIAVRDYLITAGVDATRMIVVGYGDRRPLGADSTGGDEARSRRAVAVAVRAD